MNRALRFEPLEVRRLLALSPVGGEFKANSTLVAAQDTPAVAANAAGSFAVAWTQFTPLDGKVDVFARRFSAGGAPLGPEVRVNTTLAGPQETPAIAMEDGGAFVIVWMGFDPAAGFEAVFAQRFSAAGDALGSEILVYTSAAELPLQPVVAMDATGGFVVAWQSDGEGEGDEILARRYLNDGAPAGGAFQVNNLITANDQQEPAIGMNADGEFVIAWHGFGNDADQYGVSARRFDASAAAQGDEFQVNVTTALDQVHPAVAVGEDGRFVVAWHASGDILGELNVIGRRYDPLGAALSGELLVNTTTNQAEFPEVAMGPDGNVLVAWKSSDLDAGTELIAAREFSATGAALGDEFQVNTTTNLFQSEPALSFDRIGNAVVVWQTSEAGPEGDEIYGQRYAASGCSPRFDEFRANTTQANDQDSPQVAVDPDGDFVIVWQSQNQDGSSYGVYGQRYEAGGCPAGFEFQVNTTTANLQVGPDVATDASGSFVVVWTSQDQDGSELGVYGRVYSDLGVPLGGEIQINETTEGSQSFPAIARRADGGFVVVWIGQDDDLDGVFGRLFTADGTPLSGEFRVNTVTAGAQFSADVAIDSDGDFVVVWGSGDGDSYGIFGRRFNAAGDPRGDEFQINTFTAGEQSEPAVSMDAAGNFVVAWTSIGQDGDQGGIYAQRFDAAGNKLGGEFAPQRESRGHNSAPAVALDADGDFVVTWSSINEFTTAILGRGFTPLGQIKGDQFQVTNWPVPNGASSVALDADGDFVVAWHRGGYLEDGDEDGDGIFAQRFAAIPPPPPPPPPVGSTSGFYNEGTGTFFLRLSNSQGVADLTFNYGPIGSGDPLIAVTGDWIGNDFDKIGIYEQNDGVFFLRDSLSAGAADHTFQFGPQDELLPALAGDWDADGDDTVGLYNPSAGVFFLRNEHAAGPADLTVQFGAPGGGFTPLVGDWDGDGDDTIGLYHISTGTFFLRNSNTPGPADLTYQYGPGGSNIRAVAGDWDADGDDTPGIYDKPTSVFFLSNEHSAGAGDVAFNFGPNSSGWQPFVGDWIGPSALRLAGPAIRGGNAPSITIADTAPLFDEALRRAGGVSPQFPASPLFSAFLLSPSPTIAAPPTLRIADLPGNLLGMAIGNEIVIDHNAAGRGWFVDPTPLTDEEFTSVNRRLAAVDSCFAAVRVDLLTVIAHELGHVLGSEHAEEGLMAASLPPGVRRV